MSDFAVRVQDRDDVRVRELAVRVFLEFQSEQRGQLQHVVGFTVQQGPVFRSQRVGCSVRCQCRRLVPFGVEGDKIWKLTASRREPLAGYRGPVRMLRTEHRRYPGTPCDKWYGILLQRKLVCHRALLCNNGHQ